MQLEDKLLLYFDHRYQLQLDIMMLNAKNLKDQVNHVVQDTEKQVSN